MAAGVSRDITRHYQAAENGRNKRLQKGFLKLKNSTIKECMPTEVAMLRQVVIQTWFMMRRLQSSKEKMVREDAGRQ